MGPTVPRRPPADPAAPRGASLTLPAGPSKLRREWPVVLVGVGNLARALLRYQGFRQQGFRIGAVFDCDPAKVGQAVEGLTVRPIEGLPEAVAALRAEIGVVTVPSEAAQAVA